jgi:translation initiation factor 4G
MFLILFLFYFLFQVNNWLMWLEQAESDEDEDGDA